MDGHNEGVGLFDIFRRKPPATMSGRLPADAGERHLADFAATRKGVEAFVEPATSMTATSLLLVAHDGEWTRRTVTSEPWARRFAKDRKLPCYDAPVVGYPQRMRDYNQRKKLRPNG